MIVTSGTVASAGVLGVLIPPSVPLVVFGLLTETDIRKLFIAAVIPGLMLAVLFGLSVWITVRMKPSHGPSGQRSTMAERLGAIKLVWPVMVLFALVMGGLYGGVFTATESAGMGAAGALLLGVARRKMRLAVFVDSLVDATKTTAMLFAIVFGALTFSNFLTLSGLTYQLVAWIQASAFSPGAVIAAIALIYLALGCIMEGMGLMLLTAPLFTAVALQAGIDPIWFGVFVVMLIEIGMLTPPVGMNLFTVKAVCPEIPLATIVRGSMPFTAANLVAVGIICAWPALALAPLGSVAWKLIITNREALKTSQQEYQLLVELPRPDGRRVAQAVSGLFGLTPAEARVLGELLVGKPPAAIAQALGSAVATVRTQMSSIFSKTTTGSQSELLLLLRVRRW